MTNTARVAAVLMLLAWAPARLRTALAPLAPGLWSPPAVVVAVLIRPLWRLRERLARRRRAASDAAEQGDLFAELLVIGLSAGWGFPQTLGWVAPRLGEPLRGEVETVVRRMRHHGGAALDGAGGSAADLYRLVARAQATGAPLVEAVERFAADRTSSRRQETLAAARRLPVVLVFPLALLILPGFVLVTVAPALVAALERLGS
ncbi:MAG: type II secretion system F family protein [Acidimicrobiia bacterium]